MISALFLRNRQNHIPSPEPNDRRKRSSGLHARTAAHTDPRRLLSYHPYGPERYRSRRRESRWSHVLQFDFVLKSRGSECPRWDLGAGYTRYPLVILCGLAIVLTCAIVDFVLAGIVALEVPFDDVDVLGRATSVLSTPFPAGPVLRSMRVHNTSIRRKEIRCMRRCDKNRLYTVVVSFNLSMGDARRI